MKTTLLTCCLLFAFAFLSAQTPEATLVKTDQETISKEKIGKFEWEEEQHDFGILKQGQPEGYRFKFKNVGTAPITITNVRRTCGCTVTDWSKVPVHPGESGYVEANYNAAKMGKFKKGITVESDTDTPYKMLQFFGEVAKKESLDLSGSSMMDTGAPE